MGSVIYDFLTGSFLFDDSLIDSEFTAISEGEIRNELEKYRSFCLENIDLLASDATNEGSILSVFGGVDQIDLKILKQSAFYVERYVLADPLFGLTTPRSNLDEGMGKLLGFAEKGVNRSSLCQGLQFLKQLSPMVAADYVKVLPVSYLFERPPELPIYHSENRFSDVLPRDLLEFFRARASVRNMRQAEGGWIIEDNMSIGRAIAVEFGGHDQLLSYFLIEQDIVSFDDQTRTAEFRMHLPNSKPTPEYFHAWVDQSINRSAINIFSKIKSEIAFSKELKTSYLSASSLVNELLLRFIPTRDGVAQTTATTLLNLDLPFLDDIDLQTVMRVRQSDGEVFQNFRNELNRQMSDLRFETDYGRFKVRAEKVIAELGDWQVHELKMKMKELRRGALAQAAIASASLIGSLWVPNLAALAPIVALAEGVRIYSEYRAHVRTNPAFFLWKVSR